MNAPLNFFMSQKRKILVSLFSMLSLTTRIASAQVPEDQQVTEDPRFSTQVTFARDDGIHKIEGGTTPDNNSSLLFHSFDRFSLNERQTALFVHGTDIATILSRVTGNTSSQINGVIEAGDVDMFIINPHGITFGAKATLDVGGSFIASTADRIVFTEGIEFSATNPQPVSLLTISQPIGLLLGESPGNIINSSIAGLGVFPGESIMLVGRGISLLGGGVTAPSGQIEIASLGENSSVNLIAPTDNSRSVWAVGYEDENYTLADIRLSSGAFIDGANLDANGGANSRIQLRGHEIFLDNSKIYAENYGTALSEDITIFAEEQLVINDSSINVENHETAQGGRLILSAGEQLMLTNSNIDAENYEAAQSRDIEISADEQLTLTSSDIRANNNGTTRGRNLSLSASEQLILTNSNIYADNNGTAQGGNLSLSANEQLMLVDSNIYADNIGAAQGGNLSLSANEQLTLTDGTVVSASVYGSGAGGNLSIEATDGDVKLFDGSIIRARVLSSGVGNAGALTLNAASLSLQDRSVLSTSTDGQGDGGNLFINVLNGSVELRESRLLALSDEDATGAAGDLTINAAKLIVREGSDVSTSALGEGQGGNLLINALGGSVEIAGISELSAGTQGSQDAGNIQINTRTLSVLDSGQIRTETRESGNGGPIVINASESVVVTGQLSDTPSQIFSTSAALTDEDPLLTTGDAGSVRIFTRRLEVRDGATVFTTSSSRGRGGNLTVEANEVILSGQDSGLYARARSAGPSGTVNLTANTLRIENGAYLTVSDSDDLLTDNFTAQDLGTVQDANITVQSVTLNDGEITAESLSGRGGDLNFNVQDFIFLRNNSLISATAGTAQFGGDGGNVTIHIPNGFIIAVPDENSDIIANAFSGTGGNIDITSQDIIGLDTRVDTSTDPRENTTNDIEASSQFGNDGTITLNNLGLDPAQGLVELPTNTAEPNPIAQGCLADSEGRSTFVVTGQGGSAPNPGDVVRNEATGWVDLGSTATSVGQGARQPMPTVLTPPATEPILVEAQGWQRDSNGQVTLIAQLPGAQAPRSPQYSSCAYQSRS